MLRSFGISYKELEATGIMLVVKTMQIEFHSPAEFDEDLKLYTKLTHCYGARIHHEYRICREMGQQSDLPELVVSGRSSIACVDRSGKVKKLPKILQIFRGQKELDT
jgi:acyl-CoA thioester hydrolase